MSVPAVEWSTFDAAAGTFSVERRNCLLLSPSRDVHDLWAVSR